jgi:hypothetical protein
MEVTEKFGLPQRVRGYQGVENLDVHGLCFPTHLETWKRKFKLLLKVATTKELSALGGTCSFVVRSYFIMYCVLILGKE